MGLVTVTYFLPHRVKPMGIYLEEDHGKPLGVVLPLSFLFLSCMNSVFLYPLTRVFSPVALFHSLMRSSVPVVSKYSPSAVKHRPFTRPLWAVLTVNTGSRSITDRLFFSMAT